MDCRQGHLWIRATWCEARPLTCKDGSSTGTDWKEEVKKTKKNRINASSCNCTTVLYYCVFNGVVINPMNIITHAIAAAKIRNFQIEWPVTILPSLRYGQGLNLNWHIGKLQCIGWWGWFFNHRQKLKLNNSTGTGGQMLNRKNYIFTVCMWAIAWTLNLAQMKQVVGCINTYPCMS